METGKIIKDALKENKALMGSRSVISAAVNSRLDSVVYARNTPRNILNEITHYSNISNIAVYEFPGNSSELGELCGKPFSILLLGIKK